MSEIHKILQHDQGQIESYIATIIPQKITDEERVALKKETISELAAQFPLQYRVDDWKKTLSSYPGMEKKFNDPNAGGHHTVKIFHEYVKFVNNYILGTAQKGTKK